MTETFWSSERIERLRFLWSEDWTAREIAADIGCTRNAVIGKVGRMALPTHKARPRLDPEVARQRRIERQRKYDAIRNNRPLQVRKIMDKPHIVAPPPFIGDLRIPFADLRDFKHDSANQCRFIADEPPGPHYLACGNETVAGKSYCAHCTELMKPVKFTMAERIENHHLGVRRHQRMLRRVA